MPTKKALPLLTGGLNEKTRPDLIEDNQLQVCTNYEIKGDGFLYKRKDAEIYDEGLSTAIAAVFSSVSFVSEPWYPKTLLKKGTDDMDSDFILFVFGVTATPTYELHIFFTIGGVWTNEIVTTDSETLMTHLTAANITYASDIGSDIEIAFATDSVFIADGVNNTYMVSIDNDGVLSAGISGIPAPTNKPRITQRTTWNDADWETDPTATRLGTPGLFQCVYTVVTKTGEESNPSPLSDTLNLQFFDKDDDGMDELWVEQVLIRDLTTPDVNQGILEKLDKFKVYMRIIRYHDSEDAKTIDFSQEFKIIDKLPHSGVDTGNDYTLIDEPAELANEVSYENDIAPVAKTIDFLGGITMAGNVKTKIRFPWNFKYNHPITINNGDAKNYIDANIKIRLEESNIENFTVSEFVSSNGRMSHESQSDSIKHFRIFDEDLTTPIMIVNNAYNLSSDFNLTEGYIDLYIKIPLLMAATSHTIYLAWTPSADRGNYNGVPDIYNNFTDGVFTWEGNLGIHYGRVMDVDYHSWLRQQVWIKNGMRMGANDILFDPIVEGITDAELTNNRLDISQSVLTDSSSHASGEPSWDYGISKIPSLGYSSSLISSSSLKIDTIGADAFGNNTLGRSQFVYETERTVPQERGYVFWTMRYSTLFPSYWEGTGGNYYYPNGYGGNIPLNFIAIAASLTNRMQWVLGVPGGAEYGEQTPGGFEDYIDDYVGSESSIPREREIYFVADGVFWGLGGYDIEMRARKTGMTLLASEGNADWYETACLISWNRIAGTTASKMSTFCWDIRGGYKGENNEFRTSEISCEEADVAISTGINQIVFGFDRFYSTDGSGSSGDNIAGVPDVSYDNVRIGQGTYFDPDSADDVDAVKNLMNAMPPFDNIVGYKYSDTSVNNKISFGETKEVDLKTRRNMVKWTDVNYSSFPDLFFKQVREPILKVMAAPSFLREKYQNTFILFTRNTINRFVLEGTADGWSGSAASVIEEKKQYGLMAEKSLTRAGDALFWLSEVGVIMWSSQGMGLISKNIVDVPIKDTCVGFYNSINNQYILHDNSTTPTVSYVYHIERNSWTKFKGLDVVDSRVLSGGSATDNINLILDSGSAINKYPGSSDTTTTEIKTKDLFFEKGVLRRMKVDYEQALTVGMVSGSGGLTSIGQWLSVPNGVVAVNNIIIIDDEYIFVDDITSYPGYYDALHLIRGYNDTDAVAHAFGANIYINEKPSITSNMTTLLTNGTEKTNTNTISAPKPNQWRGIALQNSRGNTVSFGITGADTIKSIMYDLRVEE